MIFDVEIWNSYSKLLDHEQFVDGMRFEGLNEHEVAMMLPLLHRSRLIAVVIPRTVGFCNGR